MRCRSIRNTPIVAMLAAVLTLSSLVAPFQIAARGSSEARSDGGDGGGVEQEAASTGTPESSQPEGGLDASAIDTIRSRLSEESEIFRVGIAELTSIGVPVEYRYIASTIPRLLYERLQGVPVRLMTTAELEHTATARLDDALRSALTGLTSVVNQRDALLFSRAVTDEQRATANARVEEARLNVTMLQAARPVDFPGPRERTIEFAQVNRDGRLLSPLENVPSGDPASGARARGTGDTTELERIAEQSNLDLVIFGSIEEIVGYIAIDIYAYNRILDEVVLVGGTVGLPQEVGEDAQAVADDLAADLLGRDWSTVVVRTTDPDAQVVIDGKLVGFGEVSAPYLTVGNHIVSISGDGYDPVDLEVTTDAMETAYVDVDLVPSTGRVVRLESSPAGATVYVDSVYAGTTPMSYNFTRMPALVRIQAEGYLESRFVVDSRSPETVARALLRSTTDWTAEIEARRSRFYRSLSWFVISVPVTLALRGGYLNVSGAFPPYDDATLTAEERASFARLGNILYWSSLAGVMVNVGLFANTVLDIRDYIQVGEGSHNQ